MEVSELARLDKNVLIKLLTTLETQIRKEHEPKFKALSKEKFDEALAPFRNPTNKIYRERILLGVLCDTIKQFRIHPVSLELIRESAASYEDVYWDKEEEFNYIFNSETGEIKLTWDSVIEENINKVIVFNNSGFNNDDRSGPLEGFDDKELICEFIPKNGKLTLGDISEAIYRVKGSKGDFWYELFCNINTHLDGKGILYVNVTFDHGS